MKDLRAASPEPAYAALHSQVLHDVRARLDRTAQAFFRRVQRGATAGFPRFTGRNRWHSFTFKEEGTGARRDTGGLVLVLAKLGSIAVHRSRPLAGTPKTVTGSQEADGWDVAVACAEVPAPPWPETGRETGIDVGLKVVLITAAGAAIDHPRHSRHAERSLVQGARRARVCKRATGRHRRHTAVCVLARAQQHVRRPRADFQHQTARALVRVYDPLSVAAIPPAGHPPPPSRAAARQRWEGWL